MPLLIIIIIMILMNLIVKSNNFIEFLILNIDMKQNLIL